MLWRVPARIELETEENIDWRILAGGMQVELEIDLRSRCDQAGRPCPENIGPLPDRVFIEKDTLLRRIELNVSIDRPAMNPVVAGLHHRSSDVMDVGIAPYRNDLNCLDEAVLG